MAGRLRLQLARMGRRPGAGVTEMFGDPGPAHSARQEHADQGSIPVAAQRREHVIDHIVRHGPWQPVRLLLPVGAAPVLSKRFQRIVVCVQPAAGA